jgi:hypothetical protein
MDQVSTTMLDHNLVLHEVIGCFDPNGDGCVDTP